MVEVAGSNPVSPTSSPAGPSDRRGFFVDSDQGAAGFKRAFEPLERAVLGAQRRLSPRDDGDWGSVAVVEAGRGRLSPWWREDGLGGWSSGGLGRSGAGLWDETREPGTGDSRETGTGRPLRPAPIGRCSMPHPATHQNTAHNDPAFIKVGHPA